MDLPFNKTGIVRPACKLTDSRSTDDYLKTLSLIPKSEMERLFSKAKLWGRVNISRLLNILYKLIQAFSEMVIPLSACAAQAATAKSKIKASKPQTASLFPPDTASTRLAVILNFNYKNINGETV